MKVSDYIVDFLSRQGIKHAFVITGGAAAHLIDSIARNPEMDYICTQHEQAAAMAADAYSRVTGNLGVAVATSGPGATNLLTGIGCAYCDSIPVIYITGQVVTHRLRSGTGVRQLGFQEAPTVEIYKPTTKYAVLIDDLKRIRYEMEKATYLAKFGRPGPVLIDIPDNLQREQVNPHELESFVPEESNDPKLDEQVDQFIQLLERARRPVVILGWGIRLAQAEKEAREFINKLRLPVLLTWATMDMLPSSDPLVVGSFGQHGTRYGNFTVQNADLVLAIGSRLDTHLTGASITSFAREAKKIIADIDLSELNKYKLLGMDADLLINADAKGLLRVMNSKVDEMVKPDISEWKRKIETWKAKYPICLPEYYQQEEVNPYVFVKALARESPQGSTFLADTGCGLVWLMQAFEFKQNQRLFSAFNNTPMGYSLPASIGACFALGKKPVICITGDGGLQVNIQEMATIIRHDLPVKIFLINNRGYSMVRQTQEQWFGSRYEASTVESGLPAVNFVKVAEAYGFKALTITTNRELGQRIRKVLDSEGPVFCDVKINPNHRVIPQVRFGRPIEDGEPFLDRDELLSNMIVKPMEIGEKLA